LVVEEEKELMVDHQSLVQLLRKVAVLVTPLQEQEDLVVVENWAIMVLQETLHQCHHHKVSVVEMEQVVVKVLAVEAVLVLLVVTHQVPMVEQVVLEYKF
jgi:hypothetical protein